MDKTMLMYACVLLSGTLISAVSQEMLKKAAMKQYDSKIKEYLNPLVIIAYMIFVAATLLSVVAYRGIPLSMGPVLESTGYIYVTIFGALIFHEKINWKKILALLLIITGIVVYSVLG